MLQVPARLRHGQLRVKSVVELFQNDAILAVDTFVEPPS